MYSIKKIVSIATLFSLSLILVILFQNGTYSEGYDVILVMGQSNAAGTGLGNYTVDKSVDSRIFQMGRYKTDNK
jgi:hypothetical protein